MADIVPSPSGLSPYNLSLVPSDKWFVGTPVILPKWKAPGVKWRLIVNKHMAPCSGLHSVVARAVDLAIYSLPRESYSDFSSPSDFLKFCADFNNKCRSDTDCITIAGDMVDCFRHLDVPLCCKAWACVEKELASRRVRCISLPRKSSGGRGRLGRYDSPGWVVVDLDWIASTLAHFAETNFVFLPGKLGREVLGAPMGDSLSGALLSLFKWYRESRAAATELLNTVFYPSSRRQLVHLQGVNVQVLDVSFRDDLRLFCRWSRASCLNADIVRDWAWDRLNKRFCVGSMRLDAANADTFIGLSTIWQAGRIIVAPEFPDPWCAAFYNDRDSSRLKPWGSWSPMFQKRALVCGLLCRCWYLSSSPDAKAAAIWEALVSLLFRALFPTPFVARVARKWARHWIPAGCHFVPACNLRHVNQALSRLCFFPPCVPK